MKFFRYLAINCALLLALYSCNKNEENRWDIEVETPAAHIPIIDISKEFFDPNVSIEDFKSKYPWFQGSVKDEDFVKRRQNEEEIRVYKEAIKKIDVQKLSKELTMLFARVRHYFPNFKNPKVYIFSSSTQMYQNPVIFDGQKGFLFIDISGFMGEDHFYYKGIEKYFTYSMNPNNIIPKVSEAIALSIIPYDADGQKFLDTMVYHGKMMILQDAFMPKTPDFLKMNQSKKQIDWSVANEANIWDYFVEENLVFSPDPRLQERFISPGPFSKFYTEVDRESSPQVGIFIGWQICKKYLSEKPDTKLLEFMQLSGTEIFNSSNYKPKS